MKNLYLWQPQYAVENREEDTYWIPYSVGCLWSYANQFEDIQKNWNLAGLIFRRESPEEILSKLESPRVCGFSCYVWNEKYCLTLAEMVKQQWPDCIIIFGGPQASGSMLKYDFLDSIIMAEGEEIFLEILRSIDAGLPVQKFYQKRRLEQLDIPSPYLTGVFDQVIQQHPKALWSVVLETNRGCPYACTFCDWGGVTYSKIKKFPLHKIQQELAWCAQHSVTYIFLADANFGIFKQRDLEIARMIKEAAKTSRIETVNVQFAKNSTEVVFDIAKELGSLHRGITLSVQSMNQSTLVAIKRDNMQINDMRHMIDLAAKHDIPTYTEIILGLPLETAETWKQGLAELLEVGQHDSIDLWFSQLLENSELNTPENRQRYGIQSVRAQDYMPLYNKNDYTKIVEEIEIIKSTSTMNTEQMVDSYLYAWLYIHMHISGYSQIYAKYARHCRDIPYRKFYDHIWQEIWQDEFLCAHLEELQTIVSDYLETGRLSSADKSGGGHVLHARSFTWLHQNRHKVYDSIKKMVSTLIDLPDSLIQLQQNYLIDPEVKYPVKLNLAFDISTWRFQSQNYEILPRLDPTKNFDFYRYRRQGLVKNKIIAL